jgi:hypothetical protein
MIGETSTAVELGAGLAAIARRRLASFPSAAVLRATFEDWEPGRRPFDAVAAVNSLHWIDPRLRYSGQGCLERDSLLPGHRSARPARRGHPRRAGPPPAASVTHRPWLPEPAGTRLLLAPAAAGGD